MRPPPSPALLLHCYVDIDGIFRLESSQENAVHAVNSTQSVTPLEHNSSQHSSTHITTLNEDDDDNLFTETYQSIERLAAETAAIHTSPTQAIAGMAYAPETEVISDSQNDFMSLPVAPVTCACKVMPCRRIVPTRNTIHLQSNIPCKLTRHPIQK